MRSANPLLSVRPTNLGRLAMACILCILPACGINETTAPRLANYYPLPPWAQVGDEFFIRVHSQPMTSDVVDPMAFVRVQLERLYEAAAAKGSIPKGTPVTGCGGTINPMEYQHDQDYLFCVSIPNPTDSIPQLLGNFQIEYVEAHGRVVAAGIQLCPPSWGLDQVDQHMINQRSGIFAYSKTGNDVRVYVVDTGIDEASDGQKSYNHISGQGIIANSMAAAYTTDKVKLLDEWGHGTLVSGIVASRSCGVAKNAEIYPVKVEYDEDKTKPGIISAKANSVYAGISRLRLDTCPTPASDSIKSPAVVLLPFTTEATKSITLGRTVEDLLKCGYVVVASAGNIAMPAELYSPADVERVITVGSFDTLGNFDPKSNYGVAVDILAPGREVFSLVPAALKASVSPGFSGTSAAAAHVAGVAAQILEAHAKDLTNMKTAPDLVTGELLRFAASGIQKLPPNTVDRALVSPYGTGVTDDKEEVDKLDGNNDAVHLALCPENMSCDISKTCGSLLEYRCSRGLQNNEDCSRGVLCEKGLCTSCGLKNERCCGDIGIKCRDQSICVGGRCVCGKFMQPCCRGSVPCDSIGLGCDLATNVCKTCGLEKDQPCCADGSCTGPNLYCAAAAKKCQPCGESGQVCCDNMGCGANQVCKVGTAGEKKCEACGSTGQSCCKDLSCGSNLVCQDDKTCQPCGGPGQPCCKDLGCQSGNICQPKDGTMSGGDKTCQPCGAPGELCCPGPKYCNGEMTCSDTASGRRCNGECYARCKNGLLLYGKDQVDRSACIEFGRVQCNACAIPPSIEQLLRVQYLGVRTDLRSLSCPVRKEESCEDCGGDCEKTDMSMLTCKDESRPTSFTCGKFCSDPDSGKLAWCIRSRTSCQP